MCGKNFRTAQAPLSCARPNAFIKQSGVNRYAPQVEGAKMEDQMLRKVAIGCALALATALAVGPQVASAVTIGPHSKVTVEGQLLQQVQNYPGYCRFVRRECAERFGWGSRPFYRCLERRGCGARS